MCNPLGVWGCEAKLYRKERSGRRGDKRESGARGERLGDEEGQATPCTGSCGDQGLYAPSDGGVDTVAASTQNQALSAALLVP